MSDKEDANSSRPVRSTAVTTVLIAALSGAAIGVTLALISAPLDRPFFEVRLPWTGDAPLAREWPGPPRAGESATVENRGGRLVLLVRAPRAPRASELAGAIAARRRAGVAGLADALIERRARWQRRPSSGPLPPLSPVADASAWLIAQAEHDRDLATHLPPVYTGAPPAPTPFVPAMLREPTESAIAAARAGNADDVRARLASAESQAAPVFAAGFPSAHAPAAARGAAWRAWRITRAESLEAAANRLLAAEDPLQRELAFAASPVRLIELDALEGDVYAPLAQAEDATPTAPAVPLPGPWGRLLGAGALAGTLVATTFAMLAAWPRRTRRAPRAAAVSLRDPADPHAWLHVVAGPSSAAVTRAVLELCAHALARRERVLVVDGGPRLKLHERFGREARWGLMECLLADMPVLGLVQYGGRPGLYLLAHGNSQRGEGWASLGRRLDDARPHFARVILAIEPGAPRALGDALMGRAFEGWWSESVRRLPNAAVELSARLGIAFTSIELASIPDATLEALDARVQHLAAVLPPPIPAPEPVPITLPAPLAVPVSPEPVVLDCDLQVQQRLRFLAWMRRVQSESRRAEAEVVLS